MSGRIKEKLVFPRWFVIGAIFSFLAFSGQGLFISPPAAAPITYRFVQVAQGSGAWDEQPDLQDISIGVIASARTESFARLTVIAGVSVSGDLVVVDAAAIGPSLIVVNSGSDNYNLSFSRGSFFVLEGSITGRNDDLPALNRSFVQVSPPALPSPASYRVPAPAAGEMRTPRPAISISGTPLREVLRC